MVQSALDQCLSTKFKSISSTSSSVFRNASGTTSFETRPIQNPNRLALHGKKSTECATRIALIYSDQFSEYSRSISIKFATAAAASKLLVCDLKHLHGVSFGKILAKLMDGIPKENNPEFLRMLECPVCKEVCPPPLYTCVNGHWTCGSCLERLEKCPLCSGELTKTRNVAIEHITSLVRLKCNNTGCEEYFNGDLYKAHVTEECSFRPVACYCQAKNKCNGKEIEASNYEQHLKNVHKCLGFDSTLEVYEFMHSGRGLDSIGHSHHRINYMKYNENFFMLNDKIDNKVFWSWVTIAGSEEEAMKFEASLTYYEFRSKARCAWKVNVHSYRKSVSDIHKSGHLVGFPTCILMPLTNQTEFIHETRKRKAVDYEWRVTIRIYLKEQS